MQQGDFLYDCVIEINVWTMQQGDFPIYVCVIEINVPVQHSKVTLYMIVSLKQMSLYNAARWLSWRTAVGQRWRASVRRRLAALSFCWKTCDSTWKRKAKGWALMAARSRPPQMRSRNFAAPCRSLVMSMSTMHLARLTEPTGTKLWFCKNLVLINQTEGSVIPACPSHMCFNRVAPNRLTLWKFVINNNNRSHFCSAVSHWQGWAHRALQDQQNCVH